METKAEELLVSPAVEEKLETVDMEKQKDTSIKVATMHQKALYQLVQLDIRNYLAMLTAPGVSGNEKSQIKLSIERAILAAFDYGVEVANVELLQKGKLAHLENSFAAHMARLKENGMIIIAQKYEDAELEKLQKIKEGESNGEVNKETDQEINS